MKLDGPTAPLPGPFNDDPTDRLYELAGVTPGRGDYGKVTQLSRAQLGAALTGLPHGTYDDRIAQWLSNWEPGTVAAVASWVRRAYETGLAAGKALVTEDIEAHPLVQGLRLDLERATALIADLESGVSPSPAPDSPPTP